MPFKQIATRECISALAEIEARCVLVTAPHPTDKMMLRVFLPTGHDCRHFSDAPSIVIAGRGAINPQSRLFMDTGSFPRPATSPNWFEIVPEFVRMQIHVFGQFLQNDDQFRGEPGPMPVTVRDTRRSIPGIYRSVNDEIVNRHVDCRP